MHNMRDQTISRKYYKKRLWKITVTRVFHHRKPFNVKGGYSIIKFYERRKAIGEEWKLINSSRMEGK